MLSNPLKLDVITFATIALPATPTATFSSISSSDIAHGGTVITAAPAGHPAPLFAAVSKVSPVINFTTDQVDTVVGAMTAWGAAFSAKLYQKLTSGVAPFSRASLVHKRHDVAAAVACWQTITLPALGVGTANVMLRPIYNGTALPIVNNGSVALPAGTMVDVSRFAAGPVYINTVLLDGVESITISSGVQFRGEFDSSSIYDTFGELTLGQTVVTIKTKNQINWATVLIGGLGITALTFYAKKWANISSDSFVANATAQHIKFNSAGAVATPINSQADGQGLYSDTLQIVCVAPDDTQAPLTATLLQAIV